MRIVFMGTPEFAVPSLKSLVREGHEIAAVVTQPDRPAGRGKKQKASPVKEAAFELGLTVWQPEKINTSEALEYLAVLQPELIVVVAYGKKLPVEILHLPAKGCLNVHASLLPAYRGAAPIHWAVIKGETETGVTTMMMDEGLDTGDILLKKVYPISAEVTTGQVHDALAELGAELLIETIAALARGDLQRIAQTGESSYAPMLKREHESLDWSRSALELHNQIRGLNPWPGAFTTYRGEDLKVWRSALLDNEQKNPGPKFGKVLRITEEGLVIETGKGELLLREVQPAGKRSMPARDFFLGRQGQVGDYFGS
jgi:methionyl-tRNA formyltransferase